MPRIAYVNGAYVPHGEAAVHIEDRGFQFADAVYEVISLQHGHFVDLSAHVDRLERSLSELAMGLPMTRGALKIVMRELVRRNRLTNGAVYLQVTRGRAARDFPFPEGLDQTVVMTAKRLKPFDAEREVKGVDVITVPDIRWKRCDIKTVGLLGPAMGKTQAVRQGAFEAWQVDEQGFVTEGTSSNAWIVTDADELVTRAADSAILNGITRQTVLKIADQHGLKHVERPFTVAEAQGAREAFNTSATAFIRPVVRIDGATVGTGKPGLFCEKLIAAYRTYMEVET